jgi:3-methyladenine DNA glycosylase AlkD
VPGGRWRARHSLPRIRPDDAPVWQIIATWAQGFDSWALADHASIAGAKRLQADPARLDEVERWTTSENKWTRRAALVITLPWARMTHPNTDDLTRRERILSWAEIYVPDREWFIQKAVAWRGCGICRGAIPIGW